MSLNLTIHDPNMGHSLNFLWQTPTEVTRRLVILKNNPPHQVAHEYLDWVRQQLELPPITPAVRCVAVVEDAERWAAIDPNLRKFCGKMSDVVQYLEHERQVLEAVAVGCTFSWS